MKYKGKHLLRRIPRALYGRFDPYVFTFDLETKTVSTLIIFQEVNVSQICICVAPRGHDVIRK